MRHTANWQVTELNTSSAVMIPGKSASLCSSKAGFPSGGQTPVAVRKLKYAAKSPAKNMISETMKRSIPSTGLPSPFLPCAAPWPLVTTAPSLIRDPSQSERVVHQRVGALR